MNNDQIIQSALSILEERMRYSGTGKRIANFDEARKLVMLHLGAKEQEVFACLFFNTQHQLIAYKEMFFGTINETMVYPREVVKEALRLNAAAVIFAHNHPSGNLNPSQEDVAITKRLKTALALVDVDALDHIVVSGAACVSMKEKGLIQYD